MPMVELRKHIADSYYFLNQRSANVSVEDLETQFLAAVGAVRSLGYHVRLYTGRIAGAIVVTFVPVDKVPEWELTDSHDLWLFLLAETKRHHALIENPRHLDPNDLPRSKFPFHQYAYNFGIPLPSQIVTNEDKKLLGGMKIDWERNDDRLMC